MKMRAEGGQEVTEREPKNRTKHPCVCKKTVKFLRKLLDQVHIPSLLFDCSHIKTCCICEHLSTQLKYQDLVRAALLVMLSLRFKFDLLQMAGLFFPSNEAFHS